MKRIIYFCLVVLAHVAFVAAIPEIDPPIPCQNISDCRTRNLPQNATCENQVCMCYDQQNKTGPCSSLQAGAINHGKTHAVVGRICKVDQDCYLEHGMCNKTNSQCACVKGYVPSDDKHSCVEERSLGENCFDDGQCSAKVPNSICLNKSCACNSGYHHVDGKCLKNIAFGLPCNDTRQCSHIENATCTEKKICGCQNGTAINMDGKRCLLKAKKILDECMEDGQCSSFPGTACIEKRCQCNEKDHHYVPAVKTCVINKALGEECSSSDECYQGEKEGEPKALKCFDSHCECADDFYEQEKMCTTGGAISVRSSVFVMVLTISVCSLLA